MKSIPFWNPLPEYEEIATEVHAAIARVLSSGTLILGPEVAKFESSFSRYVGCRYGIGVGNGTDAIILALKALGVGVGHDVIAPANTAIPTIAAILAVGAAPKLIDVDPATLLMDPSKLEATITKQTRCIIPVHLYGQVCDMRAIMNIAKSKKLFVLEDCAQSTGATYNLSFPRRRESRIIKLDPRVRPEDDKLQHTYHSRKTGSMGDIAAFSFYPTKIIGAYGDGGLITTNNVALAKRVRMLRMYGTKGRYIAEIEGGINSRLDELHAAILSVKLKYIDTWIKERQRLAKRYDEGLKNTPVVLPNQPHKVKPFEAISFKRFNLFFTSNHVFHLYIIKHHERNKIQQFLLKRGIGTAIHYPVAIHLMPAYKQLGYAKGDFPVAETACRTVLSLPLYPGLPDDDQDQIISILNAYFK